MNCRAMYKSGTVYNTLPNRYVQCLLLQETIDFALCVCFLLYALQVAFKPLRNHFKILADHLSIVAESFFSELLAFYFHV